MESNQWEIIPASGNEEYVDACLAVLRKQWISGGQIMVARMEPAGTYEGILLGPVNNQNLAQAKVCCDALNAKPSA